MNFWGQYRKLLRFYNPPTRTMAQILDISESKVRYLKYYESKVVPVDIVDKVSKKFGVSKTWLIDGNIAYGTPTEARERKIEYWLDIQYQEIKDLEKRTGVWVYR